MQGLHEWATCPRKRLKWGKNYKKNEEKWEKLQENEERQKMFLVLSTWEWEADYSPGFYTDSFLKLEMKQNWTFKLCFQDHQPQRKAALFSHSTLDIFNCQSLNADDYNEKKKKISFIGFAKKLKASKVLSKVSESKTDTKNIVCMKVLQCQSFVLLYIDMCEERTYFSAYINNLIFWQLQWNVINVDTCFSLSLGFIWYQFNVIKKSWLTSTWGGGTCIWSSGWMSSCKN